MGVKIMGKELTKEEALAKKAKKDAGVATPKKTTTKKTTKKSTKKSL